MYFGVTLDDSSKKQAVDYMKMTIAIISGTLYNDGVISKEDFDFIKKDVLKIYRQNLKDYDGENLDNNIAKYFQDGVE